MTVTFTTDPRPTVVGNLIMYTGTFTDDNAATPTGDLDLSASLASITACGLTTAHPGIVGNVEKTIDGAILKVTAAGPNETGTWWAMGPRS